MCGFGSRIEELLSTTKDQSPLDGHRAPAMRPHADKSLVHQTELPSHAGQPTAIDPPHKIQDHPRPARGTSVGRQGARRGTGVGAAGAGGRGLETEWGQLCRGLGDQHPWAETGDLDDSTVVVQHEVLHDGKCKGDDASAGEGCLLRGHGKGVDGRVRLQSVGRGELRRGECVPQCEK